MLKKIFSRTVIFMMVVKEINPSWPELELWNSPLPIHQTHIRASFFNISSHVVAGSEDGIVLSTRSHFCFVMDFTDHRKPLLWITLTFSTAHFMHHYRLVRKRELWNETNNLKRFTCLDVAEPVHWKHLHCRPWQKWPLCKYVPRW